jgi:hypothetical protein
MYPLIPINVKALVVRNSISRSPLRRGLPREQQLPRTQERWIIRGFLFIPLVLALAWLALSPTARAVDPPPDGGYPIQNTAEGDDALFSLTTGFDNTAIGSKALYYNTTGDNNTANGKSALESNTTGRLNTADGAYALSNNTTGFGNTATGLDALYFNTTGNNNTASGYVTLWNNFTGNNNTANGSSALHFNTTGNNNTATGGSALFNNGAGNNNTGNGAGALQNNRADNNTANGFDALLSNTTGGSNIALGFQAGMNLTTGSNNIDIGAFGAAGESNTIRIGKHGTQTAIFIAGISGATVTGRAVVVDNSGQLGVAPSSERFKDNIKPMDKASEAILTLEPVTFRYKHELDPDGIPQFGLVAEQVEKVNPDLVARDASGKVYTVRYEAVNAMLLNEFLKEHRKVQELEATVAKLESAFKEQAAQIQKVSDQLEAGRATQQLVANN